MKFNVKYNDEGTKIGATLKIKDDGLTITYVDYVINIHYKDIEDISFQNGVLKIYENDNKHIIYCSEDVYNVINSKCDIDDFEEEIEEAEDVEEEIKEDEIESKNNNKSYKAIVFLPNGQGECTLSLNSKNIVIDDGVNTLRIPVSSIIRIILEDNNNIKVLSNNNKNIVIKSNQYKEIYNELKGIKKNTKHDTNATITIKDAFGNDLIQSENKKGKSPIWVILGTVIFSFVVGLLIFLPGSSSDNINDKLTSAKYWMGNIRNNHTELDYSNYTVITYDDNTLYSFNEDGTGNYYDITSKTIDGNTTHNCNIYRTFKYEYKNNSLIIYYTDDNSQKVFNVSIDYDSKYKHDNLFLDNEKYSPIDDDSFNNLKCNK